MHPLARKRGREGGTEGESDEMEGGYEGIEGERGRGATPEEGWSLEYVLVPTAKHVKILILINNLNSLSLTAMESFISNFNREGL